ncbi:uncharacterized protein LACBIDRAFT_328780 [Laccaria bicolor S238N-H82]|uniref:Predicted protein n=1 Tax=Laccaria bicolor (strain S238N-H82 / ATCC MYA-4686) TaxID=486041 RepID=B0DFZ0_LACBS|nr:uncharacterized protein LACBIDRAFT_328780 [Laccaria bicolor S238N-H82]EDR06545.1 predicted protein [Laccaria bicolor S238N-H82]|eukprot:XP_001882917.1 predicted protein [Laccaria bicolor S238N-H82]
MDVYNPLLTESGVEAQDNFKLNVKDRRPIVYDVSIRVGIGLLGVLGIVIAIWWTVLAVYIIQCFWKESFWKDAFGDGKSDPDATPETPSKLEGVVAFGGKGLLSLFVVAIGIVPGVAGY